MYLYKLIANEQVDIIAGIEHASGYIDGIAYNARFKHLAGIALDYVNDLLLIADSKNNKIRKLNIKTGGRYIFFKLFYHYNLFYLYNKEVTTIRWIQNEKKNSLYYPTAVTYDEKNKIWYIADQSKIYKLSLLV